MCSANPGGGTLVYNSTLSVICLANVSRQAFGAWSSDEQYHPFRCQHASAKSPVARQPSMFDADLLGWIHWSNASKMDWLGSMVTMWVAAVEMLALLAGNYPQAAYAGFTFCLQNEWQYVQRVTFDTATHFAPLEVGIRTKFLPALLGIAKMDLDGEFRELLLHSIEIGSITIQRSVDTAGHVHMTFLQATSHLVASMVDKDAYLDLEDHRDCVVCWGLYSHMERLGHKQKFVDVRALTNLLSNIGIS
jgi:hypothetical protein